MASTGFSTSEATAEQPAPPPATSDGGSPLPIAFGIDEKLKAVGGIRTRNYQADNKVARLRVVGRLVAEGALRPVIQRRSP